MFNILYFVNKEAIPVSGDLCFHVCNEVGIVVNKTELCQLHVNLYDVSLWKFFKDQITISKKHVPLSDPALAGKDFNDVFSGKWRHPGDELLPFDVRHFIFAEGFDMSCIHK
jgi:hypothetical protein